MAAAASELTMSEPRDPALKLSDTHAHKSKYTPAALEKMEVAMEAPAAVNFFLASLSHLVYPTTLAVLNAMATITMSWRKFRQAHLSGKQHVE